MARLLATLLAASILFAAGCAHGEAGPARIPIYPVEGKLIVSGVPAANAHLAFHPLDENSARGMCPVGMTREDGIFSMTSYAASDGAPAGEYIVTVFWPNHDGPCDDPAHDRLGGLYTDRNTSTLRATVRANEPNVITLQAEVSTRGWNLPRKRDTLEKK